jgi:hypothetical protein
MRDQSTGAICVRVKTALFLKTTTASLAPSGPTQTLFSGYGRSFPHRKRESAH